MKDVFRCPGRAPLEAGLNPRVCPLQESALGEVNDAWGLGELWTGFAMGSGI